VLDVGANVGYMTALAARAVGPDGIVIAVEPEPANMALLRANVWLNDLPNVRLLPVAAWSTRQLLPLRFNAENRGDHQVGLPPDPGDAALVPGVPLDELLGDLTVDVVKVDTQGADHEAIAGLAAVLERSPQAIILTEFWAENLEGRGLDPVRVLAGYRQRGFEVRLLGEGGDAAPATDTAVMDACDARHGRFVNLVLCRS
jgi:FkbM family methyltransferase